MFCYIKISRCVNEGGSAHAKKFTFAVRVNTTDRGWTDECIGEPMPSVKKAKDSAIILLLELIWTFYKLKIFLFSYAPILLPVYN